MHIPRKEGREAGMQVEGFKVADQKFPSLKSLNIDLMFLSCLNIGQITICFIVVQRLSQVLLFATPWTTTCQAYSTSLLTPGHGLLTHQCELLRASGPEAQWWAIIYEELLVFPAFYVNLCHRIVTIRAETCLSILYKEIRKEETLPESHHLVTDGAGIWIQFEAGCVLIEGKGWKSLEPREGAENTEEKVRKASLGDSQFACGIACTQGARKLPGASVPETQTQTTKWYPPRPAALLPAQSQTTNSWFGQNCKTHFCVQAWGASHHLKLDLCKMWILRNGVFPAWIANKDVAVISNGICHNRRWWAAEPRGRSWRK